MDVVRCAVLAGEVVGKRRLVRRASELGTLRCLFAKTIPSTPLPCDLKPHGPILSISRISLRSSPTVRLISLVSTPDSFGSLGSPKVRCG